MNKRVKKRNQVSFSEFERRCQKPDHRRIGNWMVRRISRPVALRVTWVIAPWGISANTATFSAWACAVAAFLALAWGTVAGWVAAAALLQIWYLLDHVDGQLARFHGTASLDGVQLDYLMHHCVNLLVPIGVGAGIFTQTAQPLWFLGGLAWGISLLMLAIEHDTRYKAFIKRLKRLKGQLTVTGGGGGRPQPQPRVPRSPRRLVAWTARKACETHVIINLILLIAICQWVLLDAGLLAARAYLAAMAPLSIAVAGWSIIRSQLRQTTEREFAEWFQVAPENDLIFSNGWWIVEPSKTRVNKQHGVSAGNRKEESS
jgi:phosphatidylglycerophosphate synthase